ncbi:15323_t:CDS:2 [Funneliformis caledonium]|uniref:ATPase inhibitor, mitochondrial n=1 Tax=Funneliformis caledonium TaxID=1117310 RepID=A0A9N9FBS4_9GLOM|nr:15323_t:CDS:2 [Funneliformis caledonium]
MDGSIHQNKDNFVKRGKALEDAYIKQKEQEKLQELIKKQKEKQENNGNKVGRDEKDK